MTALTTPNVRRSTFEKIEELSQKLLAKGTIARFADKGEDSKIVARIIERLREAIVCYQVGGYCTQRRVSLTGEQISQQQAIYHQITHLAVTRSRMPLQPILINPFLKSSFDTLLKLREVIHCVTPVTAHAHDRIETFIGEGKAGICHGTVRWTQGRQLARDPARAMGKVVRVSTRNRPQSTTMLNFPQQPRPY